MHVPGLPPSVPGGAPGVGDEPIDAGAPGHALPAYAELHCVSNFSFLRGASQPQELVWRAHQLGYAALALTDECSLAGVVRAHSAVQDLEKELAMLREQARAEGREPSAALQRPVTRLLIGSEFRVEPQAAADDGAPGCPGFRLVAIARNRRGYANLSRFITQLRMTAPKGSYQLAFDDLDATLRTGGLADCVLIGVPARGTSFESVWALARRLWEARQPAWLAAELLGALDDAIWLHKLEEVSELTEVPLLAAGDVHMHLRSRKPLQDVLAATRLGLPVRECGWALQPNAEAHLRSRLRLAALYPAELLEQTLEVAACCSFSLDELAYEYPEEVVPPGVTPAQHLRNLVEANLPRRFPAGLTEKLRSQIEHELALIAELGYEKFFLTVHDIVRFARSQEILCQGRGSAANSAVCYALEITEVDPARSNLLFERFISRERNEPPDIDVDFEHQRREEVIQYIYGKYGRHRTALAATVITYRTRSAVRDVGKALGFDDATVDRLAKSHYWWDSREALAQRLVEIGLDPDDPAVRQWFELTQQLIGFPRHLSQHVGGFVIARGLLSELVPTEQAAMDGRSVIQWDKDDLESLKLLKVDVLALGMLTAIRKSLEFVTQRRGLDRPFRVQDIEEGDEPTYDMICKADTVGVFQIESRAQMSMLPRLQPRRYYDLVVQVAIVRPGPIQGGMVHPFLTSRKERRPVPYPDLLEPALARTNGVPIFQEQVMQIVVIGAGFTPGEADQLRRAMAAWKRKGGLEPFRDRVVQGLIKSTGDALFAERIFEMLKGFGEYGFPESHAAGFALLAYVSAWLKCHEPAAFLAGLLNAQPMGFYSPAQLVQDARRHGVVVLPADVGRSQVGTTLEGEAVRLGLDRIAGLNAEAMQRIVEARAQQPFDNVEDLARRATLDNAALRILAGADALHSLAGHRRQQVWEAAALHRAPLLLQDAPVHEAPLALAPAREGEEIVFDYAATGLSLRRHPVALLRPLLQERRLLPAEVLHEFPNGRLARACGIVTMRQQPQTAKGVIFLSLEDETGSVNVVVWPALRERQRAELLHSRLLAVYGVWQNIDEVHNLVAHRLQDLTPLLGRLEIGSRDFH
ncbi:MAG: error-prone DNA polymerase [Aquabacterium sp.]|nr:MAG: error-prone DNA polymerase [Aquabacterium sp.]